MSYFKNSGGEIVKGIRRVDEKQGGGRDWWPDGSAQDSTEETW